MALKLTSALTICTMMSCSMTITMNSRAESNMEAEANTDTSSDNIFWENDRWQDRVPREPMWFINAGSSTRNSNFHPEDNEFGLSVWWRGPNALNAFLGKIEEGYDLGARWFFINRPMGTPGNTHVPGASWLTMSEEKRVSLPERLADALIDQFDEPVHVVWFVGSNMTDPREYPGWTESRQSEFYEVGQNRTWDEIVGSRITLGGWISTGASGIGIDNSAGVSEREHFIRLSQALGQFPFNINIYGEAYPLLYRSNGSVDLDQYQTPLFDLPAIESMSWISIPSYIDSRWPDFSQTSAFPLDPDTTRMFVWFNRSNAYYGDESNRVQLVHRFLDQNLIPITSDPVILRESINRLRYGIEAPQSNTGGGTDNSVTQDDSGEPGFGYGGSFARDSAVGGGGGGGGSGGGGGGSGGGGSSGGASGQQAAAGISGQGSGESNIITVRATSSSATEIVVVEETN